jgi:hypothetical protein
MLLIVASLTDDSRGITYFLKMFIVQATVLQTSIGYLDFVASFLGWSGSQSREHWNLPLDESFRSNIRVPLRPLKVKSRYLLLIYMASSQGAVVRARY